MTEIEPAATLIVVHAQHPLEGGETPGGDFQERLDRAVELYKGMGDAAMKAVQLFVPGSLHRGDNVSLAQAGAEYLVGNGIDQGRIYGDDWNSLLHGGVYCGADEAHAAIEGAAELQLVDQLQSKQAKITIVCAAGQVDRLKLHYAAFAAEHDLDQDLSWLDVQAVGADKMHGGVIGGLAEKALTLYTRFDPKWEGMLPQIIRKRRWPRTSTGGVFDAA